MDRDRYKYNLDLFKSYYDKLSHLKRKTIREYLPQYEYLKNVTSLEGNDFFYCHVNLDLMEIRQTPPDVFSMAYETGLTLVGIGVAMNTYIMMLNSGKLSYFLPHYYLTFNCPDKYKHTQQVTFDNLSLLIALIAEDLYNAGYYISSAGGGLGVYIPMIMEWLTQVSLAEVSSLEVLKTLYKSKEFTFIEYGLRDPTYGDLMFNNITYNELNTNFSDNPDQLINVNLNILNPLRFEQLMQPYISEIYDNTTQISEIYSDHNITALNTAVDTLEFDLIDTTVDKINFTFNISQKREVSNLILTYTNKPLNNQWGVETSKFLVIKGDDAIENFFMSASLFIWQPVITNFLYTKLLLDTLQSTAKYNVLLPTNLANTNVWLEFINYYKETFNYGSVFGGLAGYMSTQTTNILH